MIGPTVIFGIFLALVPATLQQEDSGSGSGTVRLSIVNPGRYVPDLYGASKGKYKPDDSGKYTHQPVPYDGGYGDRGLKYIHDFLNTLRRPPDNNISNGNNNLQFGPRDHLRFMVDFNYNSSGWQIINFEWIRDGDAEKQYHYKNENQLWQNSVQTASDDEVRQSVENESDKYYYNYEPGNSVNDDHVQHQQHESHSSAAEDSAASVPGDYVNDEQATEAEPSNVEQEEYDSHAESAESDSSTKDSQTTDSSINTNTNVHIQGEYADHKYNLSYENDQQYPRRDTQEVRQAIQEVLDYIQNYVLPTL